MSRAKLSFRNLFGTPASPYDRIDGLVDDLAACCPQPAGSTATRLVQVEQPFVSLGHLHGAESGGLAQKAGLIELANCDHAVLLETFLAIAAKLQNPDVPHRVIVTGGRQAVSIQSDTAHR